MADIEGAAGLLEGLAQYLARSEVAVYNTNGVYAKGERGISFNRVPETPLEVVSLALYSPEYTRLSPTAVRELAAVSVQIKARLIGSPLVGVRFLDTLRPLIERRRMLLGAVVAHGEFLSYADLGAGSQATSISSTNWRLTGLQAL